MISRPRWRASLAGLAVAVGGVLVGATPAAAFEVIRVTSLSDTPAPGQTTLRQAIDQANSASAPVEIDLARRGQYVLNTCAPSSDTSNRQGQLYYFGTAQLTIQGNENTLRQTCPDRVLGVDTDSLVNINDLTIKGGNSVGIYGGGVYSGGTGEIDFKNDVFTGNHADGAGGAIATGGGKTVITGSVIVGNSSTELAGGVASTGPMVLVKSIVTGNTANTVLRPGPPPIGGIAASAGLTMVYSTVQDNTPENIDVQMGGLVSYASLVGLTHGNFTGSAYRNCNIGGGTTSLGYNFDPDGSCGFGKGPGDRSHGGDPKLRPVTTLGRLEILPAAGSPVIDAIPKAACAPAKIVAMVPVWSGLRYDLVSTPRPQGRGCDIGAIEVPVPVAAIKAAHRGKVGQAVRFSGAASRELGGGIVKYLWSFGDHSRRATGMHVKHVYRRRGRFTVTLTVVDRAGKRDTVTARITVRR